MIDQALFDRVTRNAALIFAGIGADGSPATAVRYALKIERETAKQLSAGLPQED